MPTPPTPSGASATTPRQGLWRRSQDNTLLLTREVMACVVRAMDERALYQSICSVIVEQGGYPLAAILEALPDQQRIDVHHACGPAKPYLQGVDIRLDDSPAGCGPSALAIRSGQAVAINDAQHDPRHSIWSERAQAYGIRSLISVPLKIRNEVRWLLTIYADKPNAFDPVEIDLLERLADDIAHGLDMLHTRQERDQAMRQAQLATQRLELAAQGAGVGIWEYSYQATDLRCNAQARHLLNLPPSDEAAARHTVVPSAEPLAQLLAYCAHCLSEERALEMELPVPLPGGDMRWLLSRAQFDKGADGTPRLIGVIFDVTSQVVARTAAAQLMASEEANRAKSRFISHMSHELRTPLNAVLGFSDLMRRSSIAKEHRKNLEIIHRNGEYLLSLVNDILDLSRIEAGHMPLEVVSFDLQALVHELMELMRGRASEKGLRLVLDIDTLDQRHVRGDPGKLRQILGNLLGNAIKFTPAGSVLLLLRVHPGDNGMCLHIEVQDTGIGMSPLDLEQIFEPFVQVGPYQGRDGTGLGLAITREFVELMGGTIQVASTPGSGSTFRLDLPLMPVNMAPSPSVQSELGDIIGLAPGQPVWRMLIMESRQENALLLARILEEVGLSVQIALNAREGIRASRQWQPHMVWIELNMPDMNGLEASRRILAMATAQPPKVALLSTAPLTSPQQIQVSQLGIAAVLHKPYHYRQIVDCMGMLLGMRFSHRPHPAKSQPENVEMLSPGALATLDKALRQQLHAALVSLEADQIDAAIAPITQLHPALGAKLAGYAAQFRYTPIFQALEQALPGSA